MTARTEHRPYKDLGIKDLLMRQKIFEAMKDGKVESHVLPFVDRLNRGEDIGILLNNKNAKKLVAFMFKHTAFKVFFAGTTEKEVVNTMVKLLNSGVGVVGDFAGKEKQEDKSDAAYDSVIDSYKKEVNICLKAKEKSSNPDGVMYAAFKFTTIAPMEDLMQISEKLVAKEKLEGETLEKYNKIRARAHKFFSYAKELGIDTLADAEHTTINPAINQICHDMMDAGIKQTFTVQAYLKDSPQLVEQLLAMENAPNIKLVRGAYIGADHQPREAIFDTKEETDNNYNKLLERIYNSKKVETLIVATHNPKSRSEAAHHVQIKEADNNTRVIFSKLYGMGGNLQKVGADLGIIESDYVPFTLNKDGGTATDMAAAILGCMAYFGRRAGEFMGDLKDGSGLTRAQVELKEVTKELERRNSKLVIEYAEMIAKGGNDIAFKFMKKYAGKSAQGQAA